MPASQIGLLRALPVVLQLVLILLGGAFVDRQGGEAVGLAGCLLLAAAALLFLAAFGFITFLTAHLLARLSDVSSGQHSGR